MYVRHDVITSFDRNFWNFQKFRLFLTGVLNFIFGNIFSKFRETFGRTKPLFIFEKILTVERPEGPKDRESRKAEIF